MSSGLIDVLTLQAIQALADARTFARGMAYFHGGAVGLLDADEYEARASVQGTQRYRVRLAAAPDGELDYECDCPVGDEGTFCKHAVAVALSWLENTGEEVFEPGEKESVKPRKKRKTRAEQIREYLETLSESALREWLMEAADRDAGIRDKLLFSAKAGAGSDIASLRSVVRQATKVSGFVDWREVGDYANRLGDLAQILDERIGDGNPKLVELIEDAIAQAEDALGQIDDSNGEVMPVIMQLREVHERACNHLGPDPVALAERLFRFQTTGDWDTFHSVLPSYARALGDPGLARYRQLVEAAWKKLPALGPEASGPISTATVIGSSTRWKNSLPCRETSTVWSRSSRGIFRARTPFSRWPSSCNAMVATTMRSNGPRTGSRRFPTSGSTIS